MRKRVCVFRKRICDVCWDAGVRAVCVLSVFLHRLSNEGAIDYDRILVSMVVGQEGAHWRLAINTCDINPTFILSTPPSFILR